MYNLQASVEPGPPPSWENPAPKKVVASPLKSLPITPLKAAEPCRPILKSAIRGPASSLLTSHVKKSVPNTVRFAPIETPPSPKIEKEERQIKFANNKIGAEVKPIVNTAAAPIVNERKPESKASISVEESDRLLAFKLAQEEMEVYFS